MSENCYKDKYIYHFTAFFCVLQFYNGYHHNISDFMYLYHGVSSKFLDYYLALFYHNVPSLEAVKEYSNDDFNEHFKGVNREGLIEVWGEPAGSLTEENADMWDIDDESMVVIYWKNNGKFKNAGINIK